ncbi:BMP family ABC transporter substrate-binding protein, partial [Mesorhizobium sp. M6A.T.Ca.TU.002.02.2.1]
YLSGLIAGKMSKSGTIGAVAAMGIPEVNRLVNAFFAGAREVNPDIKRKVAFIGSFFDPPKAKEAAIAQIDAGVDVIYAERFGVIEAAVEKKILAISNMSDQSSLGPDTVITGPVWDMYPTVEHAIKLVKAGVFTAQDYGDFSRMAKGGSFLAPYHKFDKTLPADVKELVEKRKAEILDGNFRVDVDENTPVSD